MNDFTNVQSVVELKDSYKHTCNHIESCSQRWQFTSIFIAFKVNDFLLQVVYICKQ